tara:strand:+ start:519 stop:668 length:150 start_codon:yes stop_codon:yes gene_type:complete
MNVKIDYKEKTKKHNTQDDSAITIIITAVSFAFCVYIFYVFAYTLGGAV